jgi:hypothetical protein
MRDAHARRRRVLEEVQQAPTRSQQTRPADDALPLIVAKVGEDARARLALKRLGYLRVLSAYLRHRRQGEDIFHGLGADQLRPTIDLVGDWLSEQSRDFVAQHWHIVLVTFAATIAAGLAFVAVLAVLG